MAEAIMARPKAERSAKRSEPDSGPRTIGVRTSAEWAEWARRGAKFCRVDVSKLFDIAVVAYLKQQGFDEPPPER